MLVETGSSLREFPAVYAVERVRVRPALFLAQILSSFSFSLDIHPKLMFLVIDRSLKVTLADLGLTLAGCVVARSCHFIDVYKDSSKNQYGPCCHLARAA